MNLEITARDYRQGAVLRIVKVQELIANATVLADEAAKLNAAADALDPRPATKAAPKRVYKKRAAQK